MVGEARREGRAGAALRRGIAWMLVALLVFGAGQGAWARGASPKVAAFEDVERYGRLLPDDELEAIDGEWTHIVLGGLYGGLGSAVSYTVSNYGDGFAWVDLGRSAAVGAASGALAAAFGNPLLGTLAGGISGGFLDRWW